MVAPPTMAAAGTSKSGAAGTRHEMAGVVLLTLALLLGLSLLSYSPRDPILFEESFHPESVQNLIGQVGMTLTTVVFVAVGGGGYLVPIALGVLGSRCFLRGGLGVTLRSAGGFTALLLFLSMLLALHLSGVPTISSGWVQEGLAGGHVGGALSGLLVTYFAPVGAHIVMIAGVVLSVLVAMPVSLVALGQQWGEMAATLREWVQERWGQFQARTGEKPKRGRDKPIKIIRLKPVVPVDAEIVQAADSAETVEPASLSQPAYRRRKRKLAIAGHRSEQLILPHVVDMAGYVLPDPAVLLSDPAVRVDRLTDEEIRAQAQVLTQALANFGIDGQVIQTHVGPVVTMYEFEPAPGTKVARIVNLADDLALALKAISLRIVAPIPGKSVVGIEVPNLYRETVSMKEVVTSEVFSRARSKLSLALGKDIFGAPVIADLKTMPHLLVAGAQGVLEAESTAKLDQPELPIEFLSEEERLSAGETALPDGSPDSFLPPSTPPEPLPYIVVMIDELADLMMVAPREVEDRIARLAQMARASGIHLVLATQRPSVDVLTGLIKANFPARIAFQVSSKTDSRTILDANGAEALVGRGDMLYLASGTGRITRLHGSFVPDDDVRRVVEFVKKQAAPAYSDEWQSLRQEDAAEDQEQDEVYEQAKDLVITSGQASASLIQRRLRVGYPRAARMIERMEEEGIVGAPARDGRREVIVRRGPVGEEEV